MLISFNRYAWCAVYAAILTAVITVPDGWAGALAGMVLLIAYTVLVTPSGRARWYLSLSPWVVGALASLILPSVLFTGFFTLLPGSLTGFHTTFAVLSGLWGTIAYNGLVSIDWDTARAKVPADRPEGD